MDFAFFPSACETCTLVLKIYNLHDDDDDDYMVVRGRHNKVTYVLFPLRSIVRKCSLPLHISHYT